MQSWDVTENIEVSIEVYFESFNIVASVELC
jgi:hypothetical protein